MEIAREARAARCGVLIMDMNVASPAAAAGGVSEVGGPLGFRLELSRGECDPGLDRMVLTAK